MLVAAVVVVVVLVVVLLECFEFCGRAESALVWVVREGGESVVACVGIVG